MTMSKLDIINDVVANGYRKVKWTVAGKNRSLVIDGSTANAMLAVVKALKPENAEKYLAMPWDRIADFAWKNVSFGGGR
jgi:hypothetical protein